MRVIAAPHAIRFIIADNCKYIIIPNRFKVPVCAYIQMNLEPTLLHICPLVSYVDCIVPSHSHYIFILLFIRYRKWFDMRANVSCRVLTLVWSTPFSLWRIIWWLLERPAQWISACVKFSLISWCSIFTGLKAYYLYKIGWVCFVIQ